MPNPNEREEENAAENQIPNPNETELDEEARQPQRADIPSGDTEEGELDLEDEDLEGEAEDEEPGDVDQDVPRA